MTLRLADHWVSGLLGRARRRSPPPVLPASAQTFHHRSLYAARLVEESAGHRSLLGLRDTEDGVFVGEVTDPLPVARDGDTVRLAVPYRLPTCTAARRLSLEEGQGMVNPGAR
jgi:hypothetical protein